MIAYSSIMSNLPGFQIADTYKSYKTKERKVINWLKEKGQKLGLPRTKGPRSPNVQINSIAPIAERIVAHGEIVPDDVRFALQDVISQRKEASVFYKPQGQVKADSGHAHYVQVLERVLVLFNRDQTKISKPRIDESSVAAEFVNKPESRNVFSKLDVEPTDFHLESNGIESDGEAVEVVMASAKKAVAKKKGGKKSNKRKQKSSVAMVKANASDDIAMLDSIIENQAHDFWEDDTDDLYFMVYCFFKDWNIIREYLQERWCDYQDGLLSLAAVSLTTNTAFELLQRSAEEFIAETGFQHSDFGKLSEMLFTEIGLAHVDYEAEDSGSHENISAEADWLALPRFWNLEEWIRMTPPKGIPATFERFLNEPLEFQCDDWKRKMERDKRFCYELITECCLIKVLKKDRTFQLPAEDELTRGVTTMLNTRTIPIWLVFAMQVHCKYYR